MSRLAGLAFLIAATMPALAAPRGRVVRVERGGGSSSVPPRLCEIRGDTGTCVGEEPQPGQIAVVFDDRRVTTEVQIVEAAPFVAGCPGLWTVQVRALQHTATNGFGVIDPALKPGRAQIIDRDRRPSSPSGQAREEVWHAVDRDGDGSVDILSTRYSCDPAGQLTGGSTLCIDVWSRTGGRLVKNLQLNFSQCNL